MKPRAHTYAIVIRLETIKARLLAGGALSCTDIAAQFDISLKTAQRDINFLRSFYHLDIRYDAKLRALYVPTNINP